MKKYILFLVVVFSMVSCQEDVQFNSPSFQGLKDNVFWRAIQSRATLANGSLTIEAYSGNEVITVKIPSSSPPVAKIYFLGTSTDRTATYVLTDASGKVTFATGLGFGDGRVEITEYDEINKTITGNFIFNVENSSDNPLYGATINFQQGVFYKVPVITP